MTLQGFDEDATVDRPVWSKIMEDCHQNPDTQLEVGVVRYLLHRQDEHRAFRYNELKMACMHWRKFLMLSAHAS